MTYSEESIGVRSFARFSRFATPWLAALIISACGLQLFDGLTGGGVDNDAGTPDGDGLEACEGSACSVDEDGSLGTPTCDDGIANGTETAVDCGGGCAATQPCALGQSCRVSEDCNRALCVSAHCYESFTGSPWTVPVKIQAEDYDRGGEGIGYHDTTYGNLGSHPYRTEDNVDIEQTTDLAQEVSIAFTDAGEWLSYIIDVAEAADNYNIELRAAAPDAPGSLHLEVDGGRLFGGSASIPRTNNRQNFTTVERNNIHLDAGMHLLHVVFDSSDTSLNWIRLTRGAAPYAGTPWPVPGRIEAEDFDIGGEGIAFHRAQVTGPSPDLYRSTNVDLESCADEGGGYNIAAAQAGDWLQYTISVAESGSYAIDLRVASELSDKRIHVSLDGVTVLGDRVDGTLQVPQTGNWQKYITLSINAVSVTQGTHAVRVNFDTGLVNLNWLEFKKL